MEFPMFISPSCLPFPSINTIDPKCRHVPVDGFGIYSRTDREVNLEIHNIHLVSGGVERTAHQIEVQ